MTLTGSDIKARLVAPRDIDGGLWAEPHLLYDMNGEVERNTYGADADGICLTSPACDVETNYGSCFRTARIWLDQRDADQPGWRHHWHLCRFHFGLAVREGAAPILDHEPFADGPQEVA